MLKDLPDDIIISIFKKMKPSDIANVYWTYKEDHAFMARLEKMYKIDDIDWYSVYQHIYELEIVEEMLYDQDFEDDNPLEFFDENAFAPPVETNHYYSEEYFDQEAFIRESGLLQDNYFF